MKLKLIMLASLMVFGFSSSAFAGAVTDTDGDLVPDSFDNCVSGPNGPNGPNDASNQVDTDMDGYGNACDADYDNIVSGGLITVSTADFVIFTGAFATNPPTGGVTDGNGDGATTTGDFLIFTSQFTGPPGPSGLSCAGTIPCTP